MKVGFLCIALKNHKVKEIDEQHFYVSPSYLINIWIATRREPRGKGQTLHILMHFVKTIACVHYLQKTWKRRMVIHIVLCPPSPTDTVI